MIDPSGGKRGQRTKICLRTQQFHYLEYVAEREEISISQALGAVLERFKELIKPVRKPTNYKRTINLSLSAEETAFLARVAADRGVRPSEVTRMIIDTVMTNDPSISG